MKEITLDYEPFKRLGVFQIGSNIENYSDLLLRKEVNSDKTGWNSYFLDEYGLVIYTEGTKIVSIACYNECLFNSVNIIQMKIGDFVKQFSVFPDLNLTDLIFLMDEEKPHIIYEFDTLGLQIWVKDNIIDSVYCLEDD